MNRFLAKATIVSILGLNASWLGAQSVGQITGTVNGPNGKPLNNAIVNLSRSSKGGGTANAHTKTGANGAFALTSILPGSYNVCVQATRDLLDPCRWSPKSVSVTSGQTTDAGVIELVSGALLRVHVGDSSGVLAAGAQTPGAHILVGVTGANGLFFPMSLQNVTPSGRDYELYVANDQSMQLTVSSARYKLADATGAPVDQKKGATLPIQAQTGNAARNYVFQVTGINGTGKN